MLQQKIREYCNSLGLDTLGFIECREFYELEDLFNRRKELFLENEFEEKNVQKRIKPNLYMEEGKTIVSIAFPYLWYGEENNNGLSLYTKGADYHKVVKLYLEKICEYINGLGGKTLCFVDSNPLPERYIAYLAGVGTIGKNNMIITEKYGSYVFLGEIITDLDIYNKDVNAFEDISLFKKCGNCDDCLKACPTKSINLKNKNPNICSSYITQKKELNNVEIKLLKNKVFGCDICQLNCKLNRSISLSSIDEFKPLEFMNKGDEDFADMDNSFFKGFVSKTSCGWRGKNVIKRNAIIKLYNEGKDIKKYKGESPYINEYISRLTDNDKI